LRSFCAFLIPTGCAAKTHLERSLASNLEAAGLSISPVPLHSSEPSFRFPAQRVAE
jgi:hypothetical protein